MGYEQVVIDAVAKDKALVTARLGLRVKRVFKRGNRTRLALVEFLQHDRTFNLSRQQRVLGISTTQHLSPDRKSTRLNSSHVAISYAVFCLKKKTKIQVLNNR